MKSACTVPAALWLAAGALLPVATAAAEVAVAAHAAPAHSAEAAAKPGRASKGDKPEAAAAKAAADAQNKVASAPPTVSTVDPLEQLRQRLADRLAGSKNAEAATANEVRLSTRTTASTLAGTAARPARGAPGATAHTPAAKTVRTAKGAESHGSADGEHWSYQGPAGPQTWGGLKPEFSSCANGQRQSPIDIRGGLSVDLEPVKFDYQASRFAVIDNGHTVQANVAAGNAIEVGGKRFELAQFHFHRPSEERIDGRQFEMSVHLVHKDEQGRLAVVTVLLDKGPAQPAVQKVWNNLPLEKNEEVPARVALDVGELLPTDRRYFTYMGSLTTPPCSEGVQWVVMRQPVTVSPEQIELFARIYPMNSRPLQQAAGRRILQSN
jgi:carbonic anhydrase